LACCLTESKLIGIILFFALGLCSWCGKTFPSGFIIQTLNLSKRLKVNYCQLISIASISVFFIGITLLISAYKRVPVEMLTRDPNAIAHVPTYFGFLSQMGILMWAGSSAICLLGFRLCAAKIAYPAFRSFFLTSTLLTMQLGLDDAFLMHEIILPKYLGIPSEVTFIVYGVLVIYFLLRFFSIIARTAFIPFVLALLFFSISAGLDLMNPFLPTIYEDGAKFIGIVSWLIYFQGVCELALRLNKIPKLSRALV
jgi:hypothetical protein